MAGKKDHSFNYWKMNYRGRFRRTKVMVPIAIVVCVALLVLGWASDELVKSVIWVVIIAAVTAWQYVFTKKKAAEEEAQEAAQAQAQAAAAQQQYAQPAQYPQSNVPGAPTTPQNFGNNAQ